MKIGFIGLGIMGRPMARNLLAAGHDLVIVGRHAEVDDEFAAAGATVVATPAEVARAVDVVITMLPDGPDVREVALGPGGLGEGARDSLVYIDMSSIAPGVAQEVGERLAPAGVTMLDAPVSGGEPKAIDGTLSVMVGGPEDTVAGVRPVLEAMAASVVRVGELGAGNVAKLANQVIVAVNIAAVAEALVYARSAGVDAAGVVSAVAGGLAGSTVLNAKAPMMLAHEFAPGFRLELHRKDLRNLLDSGADLGADLPLAGQLASWMDALLESGHGRDDHSVLVRRWEENAGVELA